MKNLEIRVAGKPGTRGRLGPHVVLKVGAVFNTSLHRLDENRQRMGPQEGHTWNTQRYKVHAAATNCLALVDIRGHAFGWPLSHYAEGGGNVPVRY